MIYYRCRKCETVIPSNTHGIYTYCKCKTIAVDGKFGYTRLIGDSQYIEKLETRPSKQKLFRMKQLSSGLYFAGARGSSRFTKNGRFYLNKPSYSWLEKNDGNCVIVEYNLDDK